MAEFIIGLFAIFVVIGGGALVLISRFYRKVDQGRALIVNRMKDEPDVTFTGSVVLPVIHRAEVMDISVKTIEIERSGNDGLICKDNIRADIKVSFYVRVNKTTEDVLKVAQSIGCVRASDRETLEQLFVAKFSEALKTAGKKLDFEQLYTQRVDFKDQIIEVIGLDLNGYVLDDVAIDYLEQTPIEKLDRDNILDAEGIRKITERTVEQNLRTNQLQQDFRKEETRQNLEADEAVLELERRKADAEAKQQREIKTMKAREAAETAKVEAEEHQRAEMARIKSNEEIEVRNLARQRQVEVADQDRERVVAIKSEQVEADREKEVIKREREVELQRIDKEMELEVKRKEIAEVVRTRIVVDKNVAEEEERIKDLRVTAEAERQKSVTVIAAQASAEEELVRQIRAAEASEKSAEFAAREKLVLANAALEEAERVAQSKARIAEGIQAEQAAEGLARVRVEEAAAVALEKTGLAEARVIKAKSEATAQETREMGDAEASAIKARMGAEADGLKEKLVAMQSMEGAAREHEEFRIQLQHLEKLRLAAIEAQREIAREQAKVLAESLGKADIQIMGGDGQFLDSLVKATSLGKSLDAFLDESPMAMGIFNAISDRLAPAAEDVVLPAPTPASDATAETQDD